MIKMNWELAVKKAIMDLALISHLQLYYIFTFALIVSPLSTDIHFTQFPFEIFQLGLLLTVTLISNKQLGNRFPPPLSRNFTLLQNAVTQLICWEYAKILCLAWEMGLKNLSKKCRFHRWGQYFLRYSFLFLSFINR